MSEAVAEGVWTVLKIPSVGNFTNARTKMLCIILFITVCFICYIK